MTTEIDRFMGKVEMIPISGCWIWMGFLKEWGYGQFSFRGRPDRAHRASYQMFVGEIEGNLWVLHRCDIPSCVNPNHLFLGTPRDNSLDMYRKERHPRGIFTTRKLSSTDVEAIRKSSLGPKFISEQYEITPQHVCSIRRKAAWKMR